MSLDTPVMAWTALVTILACLVYAYMGINVGRMRGKHGVKAPAMTGHAEFERAVRVHMNALEWLPIFLASLWLAAFYFPSYLVPGLGVVWILGRIVYMTGYMADPEKRSMGFAVQALAALALLILAVVGIVSVLMMV